jgi:hypothetical protein
MPFDGSFSPHVHAAPMATDLGDGLVRGAHLTASVRTYLSFVDVEILPIEVSSFERTSHTRTLWTGQAGRPHRVPLLPERRRSGHDGQSLGNRSESDPRSSESDPRNQPAWRSTVVPDHGRRRRNPHRAGTRNAAAIRRTSAVSVSWNCRNLLSA